MGSFYIKPGNVGKRKEKGKKVSEFQNVLIKKDIERKKLVSLLKRYVLY